MSNADQGQLPDLKVVDADTHYSEPYDLWTSRVSASLKDKVPHVVQNSDDTRSWVLDGKVIIPNAGGASCIMKDKSKRSFWDVDDIRDTPYIEDVHPAAWNPHERVKFMDEMGIYSQIMYANVLGFGGHMMDQFDPEVSKLTVQIYNDAMAEIQEETNFRLCGQAFIPFWDVNEAVKEARRIAEMGLRGVTICPEPHANPRLKPLQDKSWDPLWEAIGELGLPVNFHVGSSETSFEAFSSAAWPGQDMPRTVVIGCSQLELHNARILANLLTSDLLPRFPKTKWVMVESGIGWVPYVIERLEWQLLDGASEGKGLDQPSPRELFNRQVFTSFWFEEAAPTSLMDWIGFDNVMFQTDFPHPTCRYPNAVEYGMEVMGPWGEEATRKVMGQNALDLYNIPVQ